MPDLPDAGASRESGPPVRPGPSPATSTPPKRKARQRKPRAPKLASLPTLASVDQRSAAYRRSLGLRRQIAVDLGGEDVLSAIQLALLDRFIALTAWCEAMDAAALQGEPVDLDCYGRAASHARRIGETLGLKRQPKPVEPLHEYLARIRREGVPDADRV